MAVANPLAGACLWVALVVGEVDHEEQLQIGLHLGQERSGRRLPRARSELHVSFRVHGLREETFNGKFTRGMEKEKQSIDRSIGRQ